MNVKVNVYLTSSVYFLVFLNMNLYVQTHHQGLKSIVYKRNPLGRTEYMNIHLPPQITRLATALHIIDIIVDYA